MKTINEYIIEKILISKNTELQKYENKVNYVDVDFPVFDYENEVVKNEVWRTINLPESKYVIFKDKYRRNKPHFQATVDFIGPMAMFEDDYENFDPTEDILYASDNINDILEWYFKYNEIDEMPTQDNCDEWANKYEKKFERNSQDSLSVLANIYVGNDSYFDDFKAPDYSEKDCISDIIKSYY